MKSYFDFYFGGAVRTFHKVGQTISNLNFESNTLRFQISNFKFQISNFIMGFFHCHCIVS